MHRHGHHARFAGRRHAFPGLGILWMIGMGYLFLHGWWWPGILVLVGISMILGAIDREIAPPPAPGNFEPPQMPAPPAPAPAAPRPFIQTPAASSHRIDLLPATCFRCGAPVRAHEVKWTGAQAAACAYCGTNLSMKGSK
jgi:hypothetical protein